MKAFFLSVATAAVLLIAPAAMATTGPFLGISWDNISTAKAQFIGAENTQGYYINRVYDGTAAQKAGLKPYDYLTAVDDKVIGTDGSLSKIFDSYAPGDKVALTIVRDGKVLTKNATLGTLEDKTGKDDAWYDKALLGIYKGYTNQQAAGVPVSKIIACSQADKVVMQPNDRILTLNGRDMFDWDDIKIMINNMKPGDKIKIEVMRNGEAVKLTTRLGKKGPQPCDVAEPMVDETEVVAEEAAEEEAPATEASDVAMDMQLEAVTEDETGTALRQFGSDFTNDLEVADLNLFPNPNNGIFNLNFDLVEQGQARVMIINSTGQTVFDTNLGDFSGPYTGTINLSDQGQGIYFVRITQGSKAMTSKLVVK